MVGEIECLQTVEGERAGGVQQSDGQQEVGRGADSEREGEVVEVASA